MGKIEEFVSSLSDDAVRRKSNQNHGYAGYGSSANYRLTQNRYSMHMNQAGGE